MDEELQRYLEGMEERLMARMNDQIERVLNRIGSLERDFQNSKDFLLGDTLVSGRRWLDLDARVTKLERGE